MAQAESEDEGIVVRTPRRNRANVVRQPSPVDDNLPSTPVTRMPKNEDDPDADYQPPGSARVKHVRFETREQFNISRSANTVKTKRAKVKKKDVKARKSRGEQTYVVYTSESEEEPALEVRKENFKFGPKKKLDLGELQTTENEEESEEEEEKKTLERPKLTLHTGRDKLAALQKTKQHNRGALSEGDKIPSPTEDESPQVPDPDEAITLQQSKTKKKKSKAKRSAKKKPKPWEIPPSERGNRFTVADVVLAQTLLALPDQKEVARLDAIRRQLDEMEDEGGYIEGSHPLF